MEPFPGFSYSSNCENSMVPPLISLSSNSLMGPREGNLYTLDGNVFKLLKTVVALPFIRVCEGHSVLTLGPDGSIIARKLKDWSLIARFERYIHLNGIMVERIWLVLEKYLVGVYNLPMEEQEDEGAEGDGQFKVEIWSYQQGLKCGQSILSGQFSGFHHLSRFYSNGECEYITMMPHYSPERVISWRLDTTSVTMFDHSLSPDQLWEGLHFQIGYGVVNVLDKDGKVSHYWAVDGRDVSKPVASMLAECASYQTLTFSDGCRVKLAKDSCVYDKTGRRIRGLLAQDSDRRRRRLNAVHLAGRPLPTKHDLLNSMYQCGGIIFDRFILTISFLPSSSFVEFSETLLILYSKEGDMLGEWMLEREEREITWFVDILGRLVVMYSKAGRLEEIEVLDFRGDLSESAKEAADFQELVTFSFSDETV
ncbi:hypothetical protein FPOA_06253 [Fusarium poae]|uniref:Uncharacterized protein n=2 Tax=Fusarium poae TaxID=36050 RepID=A0A1B8AYY7_FUSPO|nr:hypothetical protein FPOA_06253 [Fusarium poae]